MAIFGRSSLEHWLDRGWRIINSKEHPLGTLQGRQLERMSVLVLLGPRNKFGASYFQIFVRGQQGQVSEDAVAMGLHNSGRYPGYNWIEIIRLAQQITFPSGTQHREELDISSGGLGQKLFQNLADLIPPGGHMMIAYDSPGQEETPQSLAIGIPPAATPLGHLLLSIGCGAGFKDWFFAEGGSEGPRKLQGYKAPSNEYAQAKLNEMAQELKAFLDRPPNSKHPELEKRARQRARAILKGLTGKNN